MTAAGRCRPRHAGSRRRCPDAGWLRGSLKACRATRPSSTSRVYTMKELQAATAVPVGVSVGAVEKGWNGTAVGVVACTHPRPGAHLSAETGSRSLGSGRLLVKTSPRLPNLAVSSTALPVRQQSFTKSCQDPLADIIRRAWITVRMGSWPLSMIKLRAGTCVRAGRGWPGHTSGA